MSFSNAQIEHLARLGRIAVNAEETDAIRVRLDAIFGIIEQMQAVDTRAVEPMSHPQDAALRMRTDTVTDSDQHLAFQRIAPQTENGLYLVPKVIE